MANPWFLLVPFAGLGWWLLGFPPGWGWLIIPVIPIMPVSAGTLVTLGTVVFGLYVALAWARNNL